MRTHADGVGCGPAGLDEDALASGETGDQETGGKRGGLAGEEGAIGGGRRDSDRWEGEGAIGVPGGGENAAQPLCAGIAEHRRDALPGGDGGGGGLSAGFADGPVGDGFVVLYLVG